MPTANNTRRVTGLQVLKQYDSNSYQINGGAAIAGGTNLADAAAFSETITAVGIAATDTKIGIAARDAIVIPQGLALISAVASATNTVTVTWRNTTQQVISPPAAGVWSVAVLGNFLTN